MTGKPPLIFVGDMLALDYLNTLVVLPDRTVDFIGDGESLLCWMQRTGMIDEKDGATIRWHGSTHLLDEVAQRARNLREWFRSVARRRIQCAEAIDVHEVAWWLNPILRGDATSTLLVPTDSGTCSPLQLRTIRRHACPSTLEIALADMLASFLVDAPWDSIRICASTGCRMMFLDATCDGGRTRCGSQLCERAGDKR